MVYDQEKEILGIKWKYLKIEHASLAELFTVYNEREQICCQKK